MAEGIENVDQKLENLEDDVADADDVDSTYFTSYEDIGVHTLMLKDKPRVMAYKHFIEQNNELFMDKIVIDVGAGTGILSLFAAKAGAKKVYAIEASNMAAMCEGIVAHNGCEDQIEVIHGRVEDVSLPDDVKADVIISEWMGFYLLHESMFNSVIVARDKWLAPDGIMVPSSAALFVCPVNMKEYAKEHFECWSDMYGLDLSPLVPSLRLHSLTQPTITTIEKKQLIADPELVTHFDLRYVMANDLKRIAGSFKFNVTKSSVMHGFACWFDVEFDGENMVTLHTGPSHPKTHWQQTVILMPDALLVCKNEVLSCDIELTQDKENPRRYNIAIQLDDYGEDEEEDEEGVICIPVDDVEHIPEGLEVLSGRELKEMLLKRMGQHHTQQSPNGGAGV